MLKQMKIGKILLEDLEAIKKDRDKLMTDYLLDTIMNEIILDLDERSDEELFITNKIKEYNIIINELESIVERSENKNKYGPFV